MNKIHYTIVALAAAVSAAGCSEADKLMFKGPDTVYFRLPKAKNITDNAISINGDSMIIFTFAYYDLDRVSEYEIGIPVETASFPSARERKYHIEVTPGSNTRAGVDYVELAPEQTFKAESLFDTLRVKFLRNNSMQSEQKLLRIDVADGGDFQKGLVENRTVYIQVSDMLEKPVWWDAWHTAFGDWHPAKLREWFKVWGTDPLPPTPNYISFYWYPQECTSVLKLKAIFEAAADSGNPFVDEYGNTLTIPANFS